MQRSNSSIKAGLKFNPALRGAGPRTGSGVQSSRPRACRRPLTYGAGPQSSEASILSFFIVPKGNRRLVVSGVTKDSAGAVLTSATVKLFRTTTDEKLLEVVSDAVTGVYEFNLNQSGWAHYVVVYKAGAPDVAGTSVNTLVAT